MIETPKRITVKHRVTPEREDYQAGILANRIRSRFRHLSRKFRRQNIDCFRLYDWDIPEIRCVVDWYAGHIVIAEYERLQTGPQWLSRMAAAVADTLQVPLARLHMKRRHTKQEGLRYQKLSSRGERIEVRERNLRFWVNLDDFLDTGLYSDHRDTRQIIAQYAKDKDFLNLYAYTGAFTVAAACAGARTTVSVDRSSVYLEWIKDNLKLNELWGPQHSLIRSDVDAYLEDAYKSGKRFTLAFVDPPSFFQDHGKGISFDINRDHNGLLRKVLRVMGPGSLVFFSTNHQRFKPHLDGLAATDITELTPKTIPEDYRNRGIHRCWKMTAR